MRLYAFLLLALCALAARAATIPEKVATVEKKIDVVPENTDKTPENVSSEQELIDQSNTINEVDNQLRAKPEDIPVEVIVENVALKKDESEEIVRPIVDLENPGLPQHQEHETQNPESHGVEQQLVQFYKERLNNAQATMKQGLKSVSENVQNMLQNNEQIHMIQQRLEKLKEYVNEQMNKYNSTIQQYMNADSTNTVSTEGQQTKANLLSVESELAALKNYFNNGVQTLVDGVQVVASLRADNEDNKPTSAPSPSTPNPSNQGPVMAMIQNFTSSFSNQVQNMMSQMQSLVQGGGSFFQVTSTTASAPPADPVQADTPQQSGLPTLPSWMENIGQSINQLGAMFANLLPQTTTTHTPQTAQSQTTENKPEDQSAAQPAAQSEPAASSTVGPIRQILQNNPISQGIASAVQRLQNANNPDKPRDTEKDITQEAPTKVDDIPKGHPPAVGDNNDSNSSRLEESEPVKELQNETVPEAQEPMKEEVKEQMTAQVVDKTE